jgi:hypothetical protein
MYIVAQSLFYCFFVTLCVETTGKVSQQRRERREREISALPYSIVIIKKKGANNDQRAGVTERKKEKQQKLVVSYNVSLANSVPPAIYNLRISENMVIV